MNAFVRAMLVKSVVPKRLWASLVWALRVWHLEEEESPPMMATTSVRIDLLLVEVSFESFVLRYFASVLHDVTRCALSNLN